jgi:hypothetical protein
MKKRVKSNNCVMIFSGDTVTIQDALALENGMLETEDDVLSVEGSKRFFDEKSGRVVHVYNLDLPAKIEAENLKRLRRSSALANVFSFQKDKKLDMNKLLPWLVVLAVIIFK